MMSQSLLRSVRNTSIRVPVTRSRIPVHGALYARNFSSFDGDISIPSWATVDPRAMGVDATPHAVKNLVDGVWTPEGSTAETISIPHPLDVSAPPIFTIPNTQISELGPFFESLRKVEKSGLHNPLKNPERYVQYGEISRKVRILIIYNNLYCWWNLYVG